ncbi:MAG: C10 family peptidase, partial [Chitinivibrionia bacterium]|nr:C10 family peptidase [Chitinivibrionia bacterium]
MKNLKTTKLSAAFIILAGIISNIFALPVDVETAKNVGLAFRTSNNLAVIKPLRALFDLTLVYTAGNAQTSTRAAQEPLFYVFNDADGFIIVSGDDAVEPILAYSNNNLFDAQKINPALQYWLDGYEKQIEYVRENKLSASDETAQNWNDYLSKKSIRTNVGGKGPLVSAKWNQSPYYNDSCPSKSVVGCVAVAMGQIMNYWKYPLKGNGYYSYKSNYGTLSVDFQSAIYNWSTIPDSLVEGINADAINPTPAQRELAKLLYHLGVSVEMDYSPEESGAYVYFRPGYKYPTQHNSQTALSTFFGYDDSMRGIARSGYTDSQWLSVIKKEIDEGRPIIYSGTDRISDGGHAFVCDGYDGSNSLYINWGWGGIGDGYFSANNFTFELYGTRFNFIDDQDILIGIAPPQKHQPFDIRLDEVETTNDVIEYGDQILLDARVSNRGSNIFRGNFCAIFSNDAGENVDFAVIYDTLISANDNAILNFSIFSLPYLQ